MCGQHRAAADAAAAAEVQRLADRDAYLAATVLVGGRRREAMPCECGALMVAGIDHTCRLDNRIARGLPID